jgi:hypothetical protein
MNEGETVEVTIISPRIEGGEVATVLYADHLNYSRMKFALKTPGVHVITAVKKAADGTVLAENTIYKSLAYSKEYDVFYDQQAAKQLSETIAAESDGVSIRDPWQVFENAAQYLHKEMNPKFLFLITALVLFLLEIAVRKFKWKWPHEIVHDRRAQEEIIRKGEKGRGL